MKRFILFVSIAYSATSVLYAQKVTGKLVDNDNNPLAGANVFLLSKVDSALLLEQLQSTHPRGVRPAITIVKGRPSKQETEEPERDAVAATVLYTVSGKKAIINAGGDMQNNLSKSHFSLKNNLWKSYSLL